MTPEVIAQAIVIFISIIGFAIVCGKIAQKVNENEKDIAETKEDAKELKCDTHSMLKDQALNFTTILKEHVEVEKLREFKMEAIKDQLQEYVKDTVKLEQQTLTNQRQTEELKQDMSIMKNEIEGIKDTTNEIKQDVVRLFTQMEILVSVSTSTQETVKELLVEARR